MAASASLAFVLQHDAVGEVSPALDRAAPGDDVTVKGTLHAFVPRSSSASEAAAWTRIAGHLDNFTYEVDTGDAGTVILVTSPQAGPGAGASIVTSGPLAWRGTHPDGSGRPLVVVHARDLESPILFR